MTLEALLADRAIDVGQMMKRLNRVAQEEGLPLGNRKMTYNSRLAQELGKWAESQGRGDPFHNAVFRAYFAEGRNIAKTPELVQLARSVGLSGDVAKEIVDTRAFRGPVDQDWTRARALGITAVPTFILNHQTVVGAQPYEVLERFLISNLVERRDSGL
jgi:predicted DsbA family dithiol-disulfide isomerase